MPKGQYPRKPRNPVEAPEADSMDEAPAQPFTFTPTPEQARVVAEETRSGPAVKTSIIAPHGTPEDKLRELQAIAPVTVAESRAPEPQPFEMGIAGLPAPEESEAQSFDEWMDEPAPIMPSDDMVGRKVRSWAATVCPIPHEVIWSPVADSSAIEVVLSTIHGTARMRKPAGQWSEGDIDFALDAMRGDLGV